MKYIGIIILLVLCLTLLLFTGCRINKIEAELESGNLENQEDINQSSNNSQSASPGLVEEPVIEEDTEATVTVYPQQWATGDGTAENPWANDCIQEAYDAVPAGGTIYLRAGYYDLPAGLYVKKKINIIGEGIGKTFIVTSYTGGYAAIQIDGTDYCTLRGFTIDADSYDENFGNCIYVDNCDYTIVEDIEAKNSGASGISDDENHYSYFHNIYSHDNHSHGMHPGADTSGGNTNNVYRDIYVWNNGSNGFDAYGYQTTGIPLDENNNVYDNINAWDNGGSGIAFEYLKGCVLSNSFTSSNGTRGVYIAYSEDLNVHDCFVTLNGTSGVYIGRSDNISLVNVISKNSGGISGFYSDRNNGLRLTNCQFYDDRDTLIQDFGIYVSEDSIDDITIINCILMPNKIAAIYNDSGAVLTVITEKREFLLLSL